MDVTEFVKLAHGGGDLLDELRDFALFRRQRTLFEKLCRKIQSAVRFAVGKKSRKSRTLIVRENLRLACEACFPCLVATIKNLQRDRHFQKPVLGPVNLARSAASEKADNREIADDRAVFQHRRGRVIDSACQPIGNLIVHQQASWQVL